MAYWKYVDDLVFNSAVESMLETAQAGKLKAAKKFKRSKMDPFMALFEISGFAQTAEQWAVAEMQRQAQKSLANAVGLFHQRILGSIDGWKDLGQGEVVDLVCADKKIIAEVKNRHNTVKGSDKVQVYDELSGCVRHKGHKYHEFTAYYVEIVPSSTTGYDVPFTPPDNKKGTKRQADENIRRIDGRKFYALATGDPDALENLHKALIQRLTELAKISENDASLGKELFDRVYATPAKKPTKKKAAAKKPTAKR
jgi:hypothetical protein